jgi:hypothetical protein
LSTHEPASDPAFDLSEETFDRLLAEAGLALAPVERDRVLVTARSLKRSVAIVDAYLRDLPEADD